MTAIKLHLTEQTAEALETAQFAEALSATDLINRAIQIYAVLGAAKPGQIIDMKYHDGTPWVRVEILEHPES